MGTHNVEHRRRDYHIAKQRTTQPYLRIRLSRVRIQLDSAAHHTGSENLGQLGRIIGSRKLDFVNLWTKQIQTKREPERLPQWQQWTESGQPKVRSITVRATRDMQEDLP